MMQAIHPSPVHCAFDTRQGHKRLHAPIKHDSSTRRPPRNCDNTAPSHKRGPVMTITLSVLASSPVLLVHFGGYTSSQVPPPNIAKLGAGPASHHGGPGSKTPLRPSEARSEASAPGTSLNQTNTQAACMRPAHIGSSMHASTHGTCSNRHIAC